MQFRLPDVGEGIAESILLKWHVVPGQTIGEDDPFCQIETDKAVVEIPAPCNGRIVALEVAEGSTILVGAVIASVEPSDAGSARAEPTHPAAAKQPDRPSQVNDTPGGSTAAPLEIADGTSKSRARAAPTVRRKASRLGADLESIAGSGPSGRVLAKDVEAAAAKRGAGIVDEPYTVASEDADSVRTPLSGLRKSIAQNMLRSVNTIPHATSMFKCDATAFVELRELCQKRFGKRISYTAMIMKAMIPALKAYPNFNASLEDDTQDVITYRTYHIGFATALDGGGLVVPVIKNADRKSLLQISDEIEQLALAARERKIQLTDLRGATITFSNLGSHGGHSTGGRPIINYPQSAIIAISRIRPEPVVHENVVCARPTLNITTSYDHRLIDGVYASGCLEMLIDIIESPGILLGYS
jgi:pyruvate dehydrogenase E2 component (dihydrolipoamide acetyltransferase)